MKVTECALDAWTRIFTCNAKGMLITVMAGRSMDFIQHDQKGVFIMNISPWFFLLFSSLPLFPGVLMINGVPDGF